MTHAAQNADAGTIRTIRGLSPNQLTLFSYGFRPFFLGAVIWALITMALWLLVLRGTIEVAGDYGLKAWHAHEMLFGFGSAVLAGFLLTAIPNWTGRLPVSGLPLAGLFGLWAIGRLSLLLVPLVGALPAAALEALFLPALFFICAREIIAGRKWADLKVLAGVAALTLANLCFHLEVILWQGPDHSARLAVSAYVMLIIIIGGRILPSFTRNWLNKQGRTDFPTPFNGFDKAAILVSLPALGLWVALPNALATAIFAVLAADLHIVRLIRWRGWTTASDPIVVVLHIAYAFVALGFFAIAGAALDLLEPTAALHILTVGTITSMMLAVMTRATRGHTGRELKASRMTCISYTALFLCALVRPLSTLFPAHLPEIYGLAGLLWLTALGLYLVEYGPMLAFKRRQPLHR
ncbi:NnrS family protein [Rhizobium rhizoryzae]|jgi:uncharacterized protein involved in response to NO|uniref:Uncharacterized protein involved in response to NO n=1 Tax=Rhizobium rhizoryzae TaxID=451876 RepID=A0A7W6PTT5_9HYPH|nr:NnrS family protein [Rhizobium rhizoryzae]MBB4145527.1 uncharacterized protein involved in response to NO [Rhizobium rhizoryzae]